MFTPHSTTYANYSTFDTPTQFLYYMYQKLLKDKKFTLVADFKTNVELSIHKNYYMCVNKEFLFLLAAKGLPERWKASFIKVSGRMRSDAFKEKASLQLHSNSFGLKQLSSTITIFHYYGTGV